MTVAAPEPSDHFLCPNCGTRITPCTVNNVTVHVATPGAGSLGLSQQQINGLVGEIQRQLMKQARRNRKPGDGGASGA